jgi:hypothetical protein
MTSCWGAPNLVKTGQKYRVLHMKTWIHFIVADDINSPEKHFCSTLNIFFIVDSDM